MPDPHDRGIGPSDSRFDKIDGLAAVYRLFLHSEASSGAYTPLGFNLTLRGADSLEHDVTHLHEIHHAALNDDTAWGMALRITFRHPAWRSQLFLDLLAACTRTHEAFATYMSIHLANAKVPGAESVLAAYPLYQRPYKRMKKVADLVTGDHQRDLLVTAIARVCMQSPILDKLADQLPGIPQLAHIPSIDRPDRRLSLILAATDDLVPHLSQMADAAVKREFGLTPSDHDSFLSGATDAQLDELWTAWEDTVFDGLATLLRADGAQVISRYAHFTAARSLIDLINRDGEVIDPRVAHAPAQPTSDFDESSAVTRAGRYPVREDLWRSRLAVLGDDAEPSELLRVVDETTRVNETPELIFHIRLPQRLMASYHWDYSSSTRPGAHSSAPLVTVRAIAEDDKRILTLFHTVVQTPSDLEALTQLWAGRGPVAACVGASCFADLAWQKTWLSPLYRQMPVITLLDTGIGQLASAGEKALLPTHSRVDAVYLGIGHEVFRGLLWHVDRQAHINLHVADSLGIKLVAGQLEDLLGSNLVMDDADWSAWDGVLAAVLRSLLATESYFGLQVLAPLPQ